MMSGGFKHSPRTKQSDAAFAFRLIAVMPLFFSMMAFAAAIAEGEKTLHSTPPPVLQPSSVRYQTEPEPDAPQDEAQGGFTWRGTPIKPRPDTDFPPEDEDVFSQMDGVPTGQPGKLAPVDFKNGDDAILGRNTWMLWAGGNEAFWGWLQEYNYGLVDFLVLLDSTKRAERFAKSGLISQPGMKARDKRSDKLHYLLGLYLDEIDGAAVVPKNAKQKNCVPVCPKKYSSNRPFKPGDPDLYEQVVNLLQTDGVDPSVYGYPSGIIGLRLWPNPDFFGNTPAARDARIYWNRRVTHSSPPDAYYDKELDVHADPNLVRPFRVGMTCGFCHVGPHPLGKPLDPDNPQWNNLSSTIGNQYWKAASIFTNLARTDNFLYHVLSSEQPGTVDTSLIGTDQINNPNTIIPIFDVPARLKRAQSNAVELQSTANLLLRSAEDHGSHVNLRHVPRVLHDGADSVGIVGSLMRVYLNIGTYSEQWRRIHNPILGFVPQRPFSVATLEAKSVYWRATEKHRIGPLLAFFTYKDRAERKLTAPMKLAEAPGGKEEIKKRGEAHAAEGRKVFLEHCALCHSSKQPGGFEVDFSENWQALQDAYVKKGGAIVLPTDFRDWALFDKGTAYEHYRKAVQEFMNNEKEDFFKDNFLSTEIRIPVTLVGTNSARAVSTNAMRGRMWDNFSSDGVADSGSGKNEEDRCKKTQDKDEQKKGNESCAPQVGVQAGKPQGYKGLRAVGKIHFYNPYSGAAVDEWGNNDVYEPPGGGPGYYRPPSLISMWATAPYLHNNALGTFIPTLEGDDKPAYDYAMTVAGRLKAFDDAVDKLLSRKNRVPGEYHIPGNLGVSWKELAGKDPGFIYRTSEASWIFFPKKFIRHLVEGVTGPGVVSGALWIAYGVVILLGFLAWRGDPRHAGFALIVIFVISLAAIAITRLDRVYWLLWLLPILSVAGARWLWQVDRRREWGHVCLGVLFIVCLVGVVKAHRFVNGELDDLRLGPIPKGTPVNLLANLNPDAPVHVLVEAISATTRGILVVRRDQLEGAAALQAFEKEAGSALLKASKCPDMVLDRGHWFAESLSGDDKDNLKAFLLTL